MSRDASCLRKYEKKTPIYTSKNKNDYTIAKLKENDQKLFRYLPRVKIEQGYKLGRYHNKCLSPSKIEPYVYKMESQKENIFCRYLDRLKGILRLSPKNDIITLKEYTGGMYLDVLLPPASPSSVFCFSICYIYSTLDLEGLCQLITFYRRILNQNTEILYTRNEIEYFRQFPIAETGQKFYNQNYVLKEEISKIRFILPFDVFSYKNITRVSFYSKLHGDLYKETYEFFTNNNKAVLRKFSKRCVIHICCIKVDIRSSR